MLGHRRYARTYCCSHVRGPSASGLFAFLSRPTALLPPAFQPLAGPRLPAPPAIRHHPRPLALFQANEATRQLRFPPCPLTTIAPVVLPQSATSFAMLAQTYLALAGASLAAVSAAVLPFQANQYEPALVPRAGASILVDVHQPAIETDRMPARLNDFACMSALPCAGRLLPTSSASPGLRPPQAHP